MKLNWAELKKLGKQNQFAMLLVATTSPRSNLGRRLKIAFPECYEESDGPVPLVVLDQAAAEELSYDRGLAPFPQYILKTAGVLDKYKIPHVTYIFKDGMGEVNIPTDLDISRVTEGRETIAWRGQDFFVAEFNPDGEITLIPRKCLAF